MYDLANFQSGMNSENVLPEDSEDRKDIPIVTGCLDYFPAALAEVARVSKYGNDKHNPGMPLHWSRDKSADHADCEVRHLLDRGGVGADGIRHSANRAWRALADLQLELEKAGAPVARGCSEHPDMAELLRYAREHKDAPETPF